MFIFQLFIEANKVTSWKGDIAIDDIQLIPGACAGGMLIIVVRVRIRGDIAIDDIQLMPGACALGMLIIVIRVRVREILL